MLLAVTRGFCFPRCPAWASGRRAASTPGAGVYASVLQYATAECPPGARGCDGGREGDRESGQRLPHDVLLVPSLGRTGLDLGFFPKGPKGRTGVRESGWGSHTPFLPLEFSISGGSRWRRGSCVLQRRFRALKFGGVPRPCAGAAVFHVRTQQRTPEHIAARPPLEPPFPAHSDISICHPHPLWHGLRSVRLRGHGQFSARPRAGKEPRSGRGQVRLPSPAPPGHTANLLTGRVPAAGGHRVRTDGA